MREIGGYIELEYNHRPMLHEGAVALNCGRSCLAYLLRARKIAKIALPYYLCDSVRNVCLGCGVRPRYYHITEGFLPEELSLQPDEWIYIVNYYGQLTDRQLKALADRYPRMILDQAQAYFAPPVEGVDTLYTCRKFLGAPDGAFLYTDAVFPDDLPRDESFHRMRFLLGRFERSAQEFYQEYVDNNHFFDQEPVKYMSKLTENLLRGIDYAEVKRRRTENYACLFSGLAEKNILSPRNVEGAFAYPLLLPDGVAVRSRLIKEKIYIPTLWPNVLHEMGPDTWEYKLAQNTLPLPCDQRYDLDTMRYLLEHLQI